MARPKSLVKHVLLTQAGKLHACKSNNEHKIRKNDWRLEVHEDRDVSRYCLECAEVFLRKSRDVLDELLLQVSSHRQVK